MRKGIIIFMLACMTQGNIFAQSGNPILPDSLIVIDLTCQTIEENNITKGTHRTTPLYPTVHFDTESSTLYFENPCYECTLEIVVPGTDSVAYTYSIPDGDNVVTLPEWLSGQYELHIHRGNFCFWGLIEL